MEQETASAQALATSDDPAAVVSRYVEAFNRIDEVGMAACFAEAGHWTAWLRTCGQGLQPRSNGAGMHSRKPSISVSVIFI